MCSTGVTRSLLRLVDQLVMHHAGRRDQAGRDHVDADAVLVDLLRESGREALERGLAHAVDGAAAAAACPLADESPRATRC